MDDLPLRKTGSIDFDIVQRQDDVVTSRMPVTDGVRNPYGIVQAGAMIWMADVTASVLVMGDQAHKKTGEGFPLAIDIHTSLVGNQREGELTAQARFVRKGRRVSVVRTRVTGANGKLLAEVTSTHISAAK